LYLASFDFTSLHLDSKRILFSLAMSMTIAAPPGLELFCSAEAVSKLDGKDVDAVWDQLTEEGPSGPSDSENDSSLLLSGSDTEHSGQDSDCISGFVSSSASDNEIEPKAPLSSFAPVVSSGPLSPSRHQRRSRTGPLAEKLSSKLLQVSAGRPVKVWLSPDYKPLKILDPSVPAKKRPSFPEHAGKTKTLDPTIPVKKHIPDWLLNFGDSTAPAKPSSPKPSSPKPPKMPLRILEVAQASSVGPAPR